MDPWTSPCGSPSSRRPTSCSAAARSPLLVGMLLDQQVPMEWAFSGPYTIARRMGSDDLDAHEIAAHDPEGFAALLAEKPAVHRYPGRWPRASSSCASTSSTTYDGDASAVWRTPWTGAELLARLQALPGFGAQKAKIFLALLGKQLGVRPRGWREAAGPTARRAPTARSPTSPARSR